MTRLRHLLPFLLLGALSVPVILTLSPHASTFGGLELSRTPDDVYGLSRTVLDAEGITNPALRAEVRLRAQHDIVRQVHTTYGLERGNEILRTWFGGYRWVARWTERSGVNITTSESDEEKQIEQVRSWLRGDVRVEYDMMGRLVGYHRELPDSLALPSITPDSARAVVEAFLRSHADSSFILGGADLLSIVSDSAAPPRPQELFRRTDHILEGHVTDSITGNPVTLRARVSGSFVSEIDVSFRVPPAYTENGARTASSVIEAVAFVALFIIIIVVSFKRFRAYEIGFRLAIVVGVASGVGLGIKLYTMLAPTAGWEIIFPLLFGPLFYGGGAILVWAAAESTVRETWREKVVTLDLLAKGYVTHSRIGQSIVRGVMVGLMMAGASLVVAYTLGQVTNIGLSYAENSIYDFVASDIPSISVLLEGFYTQVYTVAFFLMFLGSWVFRKTGNGLVAAGTIVAVLTSMRAFVFEPVWAGFLLAAIPYSLAAFAFIRYDILTAFVSLVVVMITGYGSILAASPHPFFAEAAIILAGVLGLLVLSGLVAQFRRDEDVDFEAIAPAYSKHITERERLRHELAIARSVQMSFLPKSNPTVATLDIASRCAPALEVGGDYYDFVEMPHGQLGVAVGDVSGKGTQAAFFMTLTKGFLRALARISQSPGKILDEVNRLFYENVERGVFISLVYGIFDTNVRRLTIARAGHNPVILRKSVQRDTQILSPMGLALGLDSGEIFSQSIKEVSVIYEPGDVFVFYTDGISEAMNRTKEEYGEHRLSASIEAHAHRSAADILEGILRDMHTFVGKAEQHDDVTLVVVKIM